MAKKQKEAQKKSLFDEFEEAKKKAREEFEKLSPNEQKRYLKNSLRLQHRIDVENACMCGLPIPSPLNNEELEAKADELLLKIHTPQ